jgi:hypothetical protein
MYGGRCYTQNVLLLVYSIKNVGWSEFDIPRVTPTTQHNKKNGTNGHKTTYLGFVTISTIILTSFHAERMAKKCREVFLK